MVPVAVAAVLVLSTSDASAEPPYVWSAIPQNDFVRAPLAGPPLERVDTAPVIGRGGNGGRHVGLAPRLSSMSARRSGRNQPAVRLDVSLPANEFVPAHRRLAPVPRRAGNGELVGTATWYCLAGVSGCMAIHPGGLYAAAGPALRAALGGGDRCSPGPGCWRDRNVTVWNGKASVTVTLSDWCACGGGHVIDLYSDAMKVIDLGYRTNGGVAAAVIRW